MKIEYKILWLDDKRKEIEEDGYLQEVKDYLIENSFLPCVYLVDNDQHFFSLLNDDFDLILTDYHLNDNHEKRNGDVIIEEIRARSVQTEIMFYSAQGDVKDTIKMDRITFVETKKIAGDNHYEKLVNKVIGLIQLTIKKFQHIIPMRGMIIQEASNLESDMLEIIVSYLQKKDNKDLKGIIFDSLLQFHNEKHNKVSKYKAKDNIGKILEDSLLISSYQRAIALSYILKSENKCDFIEDFKEKIIRIRNEFAHVKLLKDNETGKEFFQLKNGEKVFDANLCLEIRKDLIKHRSNMEDLKIHINKLE